MHPWDLASPPLGVSIFMRKIHQISKWDMFSAPSTRTNVIRINYELVGWKSRQIIQQPMKRQRETRRNRNENHDYGKSVI